MTDHQPPTPEEIDQRAHDRAARRYIDEQRRVEPREWHPDQMHLDERGVFRANERPGAR